MKVSDLISRQAAIEALCHDCAYYTDAQCKTDSGYWCESGAMIREDVPSAEAVSREFYEDVVKANHGLAKENINLKAQIESAEAEWIPVSERLPDEDTNVLVSYRYREGEGDQRNVKIDITSYGYVYFGGHPVMTNGEPCKHWRNPFEYFSSNYEVIAWKPLPKPWKGDEA